MSSKVYRVNDKNLIRQTTSNKIAEEVAPKFIGVSFYQGTHNRKGVSKYGYTHKSGW